VVIDGVLNDSSTRGRAGLPATMGRIADRRRESLPEGTCSAADGSGAGLRDDGVRPEAFRGRRWRP
jgi:hypothetical protein